MTQADECEEIPESMKKSTIFKNAFETLNKRNWSKKELEDYVQEQENVGRKERIFEAELDEREEIGIQKGEYKKAIETAIKMLNKDMNLEDIADLTGLSIAEIKKLQK